MSKAPKPRIVILGGGFGGIYAAKALAKAPVDLTVIDRRNYHLFQPMLYQVATAGLSPGDIATPIRVVLSHQRNARVFLAESKSVDVAARKVILSDGEIPYDYLILATGAIDNYFGHADWERKATGMYSLEDALEVRARILLAFEKAEREPAEARRRVLLTFVIVGGGPTGVELAGAIAEIAFKVMVHDFREINPREARIVLLEAGPRILPTFPNDLSAKAQADLKRKGVDVRTGSAVTAIEDHLVRMADGEIETATILWAAGVKASPLAHSLGIPLDRAGRVLVEPALEEEAEDWSP